MVDEVIGSVWGGRGEIVFCGWLWERCGVRDELRIWGFCNVEVG